MHGGTSANINLLGCLDAVWASNKSCVEQLFWKWDHWCSLSVQNAILSHLHWWQYVAVFWVNVNPEVFAQSVIFCHKKTIKVVGENNHLPCMWYVLRVRLTVDWPSQDLYASSCGDVQYFPMSTHIFSSYCCLCSVCSPFFLFRDLVCMHSCHTSFSNLQ